MKLNSKMMNLKKTAVKFMGHVTGKDGLKADSKKTKVVKKPKRTCKNETFSLVLRVVINQAKFMQKLSQAAQFSRDH